MKETPPQETSIGIFFWRGIHTKWTCDKSTLDGELAINIDYKEIAIDQIEHIIEISKMRDNYFGPAMKCAKMELAAQGADPAEMRLSGIGLSNDIYPDGFVLIYDYPNDIWPDGQLSVVFQRGKPDYCHSDD